MAPKSGLTGLVRWITMPDGCPLYTPLHLCLASSSASKTCTEVRPTGLHHPHILNLDRARRKPLLDLIHGDIDKTGLFVRATIIWRLADHGQAVLGADKCRASVAVCWYGCFIDQEEAEVVSAGYNVCQYW